MSMKNRTRHSSRQSGFTILMAALVASLVLMLGVSIFSIAQKSVALSSMGRDSQFAFYTADTGAECALYWDTRHDAFLQQEPLATTTCDGQPIGPFVFTGYGEPISFEYEPNGYCVRVTVTKNDENPHTVIRSDGYSTRCSDIELSTRALQRSVEITY